MNYRIRIDSRAARQLESLPKAVVERLDKVILSLAAVPRPPGTKRPKGRLHEGLVITEMHTSLTGVFLSRFKSASFERFMMYEQISVSSMYWSITGHAPGREDIQPLP